MNFPYWFELAIIFGITAVGSIYFGHFEECTPKGRRLLKLILIAAVSVGVSATAGRAWFLALVGAMLAAVVVIHAWWLPRRGINGWTGEPRARYYALRGWTPREPRPRP